MFDDFHRQTQSNETQKRFGGSVFVALILYSAMSVSIVAATANVQDVVPEELTQVEFAPAKPEPVPKAEPEESAPKPKPAAKKPKSLKAAPKVLPKNKLAESDAPLVDSDSTGPIDGILAVEKPKPPPPPPKPKPIARLIPPLPSSSNRAPKYTSGAKRSRIEGVVVVQFIINKDGTVGDIRIVSGPVELGDIVRKTVARWRFQPATRGGVPIAFKKTMQIQFRLEKA